jgi:hypothetical protein
MRASGNKSARKERWSEHHDSNIHGREASIALPARRHLRDYRLLIGGIPPCLVQYRSTFMTRETCLHLVLQTTEIISRNGSCSTSSLHCGLERKGTNTACACCSGKNKPTSFSRSVVACVCFWLGPSKISQTRIESINCKLRSVRV